MVLKAASKFDSDVFTTVTFTVTDPDEGKIVGDDETFEQEHVTSGSGGGCGGSASGPIGLAFVAFLACFAIFKRKRNA